MKFYCYCECGHWDNLFGPLEYVQDVLFYCYAESIVVADKLAESAGIKYQKVITLILDEMPEVVPLENYAQPQNYLRFFLY